MLTGLVLSAVLAQAAPAASPDAAEVERIRKALDALPAVTFTPVERREGPVFKVTIEAAIPGKPWDNWSNVPTYIRPYWRLYQYEFLEQLTPGRRSLDPAMAEEFRAGALYPVGVPVVPLLEAFAKHRSAARRKAQEERARDEVHAALAQLLACRADPARPGC
jgi:hypothetical protein